MVKERFFVNQTSNNDCGAACLTMILKLNNININLSEVKKELKIDNEGTSAYEIINLAKKYNLDGTGYKNMELDKPNTFFIAHIIKEQVQHFVVVLKVQKNEVLIADPASNVYYIDKTEFKKYYTKIALVFNKKINIYNSVLSKNKKNIAKVVFLTFLFTAFCIIYSYILSFILSINITKDLKLIIFVFIFIFGFVKDFINYVRIKISFKFQIIIDKMITIPIIEKIIDLPDSYYEKNAVGSLISRLNDLSYIKDMISKLINNLFINSFLVLSLVIFLAFLNIRLLVFNLILILILYLFDRHFLKRSLNVTYELQLKNELFNKHLTECFSLIFLVKNLSKEMFFKNKLKNKYDEYIDKYKETFNVYNKKNLILEIIFTMYVIFLCIYLIMSNETITNLIFIYNLETIIIDSLNSIFDLSFLYANFKASVKRLREIYGYNEEKMKENININNISFNNVNFKYNKKLILSNFNLKINHGDCIMINGVSGVGKSTIFKILLKKVKYNGNNILINNQNLKYIDNNILKENIFYIDQKIKLFNSTIKENIFFDQAVNEKVLSIVNLKSNEILNTEIDNLNSNLSSGQISKIAICQALNSNKKIIILDEVTTALDTIEERKIISNIKKHYDKTLIIITHRKSNIDLYNKIVTLK